MLPGLHFFKNGLFTQISEVLAYSFLLAAPLYIVFIFRLWSGISDKFLRVIALIQAAFYLAAFVLIFPGLISFDDMNLATSLIKAVPSGSKSLTYSFVSSSGLMLLNGFGFTVLLSISIFIFINMTVLKMLNDSKLSPKQRFSMGSLLLLLTLLPINQSQILFSCRDTIFSLFVFSLGLQFFRKNSFTLKQVIICAVLIFLLGDLRPEGKMFLFLFPAAFLFLRLWNWRQAGIYALICVSLSFVYYIAAARYFGIDSYGHSYEVSAYVQPLSQIFHDKKTSILSESEIADIDAVLDTKMLSDKFNPLDIDPYHSGAFKQSATEIQWVKFKKVSLKLIFNNLDLFFQSRIYLFKNMLNIGLSHLVFSDDVTVNQFERNSIWLTKLGIDRSSLKRSSAAVAYVDFLYFSTASQNLLAAAVSTFVLPLLLVLGCLLLFSSIPSLFTLAVIFSLRLPILFLLAPASYIQYIYSIFLFFTFVPVLLFLHYFERKKT